MKPVAIFRHTPTEGPGYFATFLEAHGVPWQLIAVDSGDTIPKSCATYSALAFMGGPMSVNDPLPWIDDECRLIRDAVANDIPVIGHCLGGQLMSKALGGTITRNPLKEIGWGEAIVDATPLASSWLDAAAGTRITVFQWHGETFSIPPSATRILGGDDCANQAFVVNDLHLAMQCHVEMSEDMIRSWCISGADEIRGCCGQPTVQEAAAMQSEMAEKIPRMRQWADRLYSRWLRGVTP